MRVLKNPEFENDDYLFRFELNRLPNGSEAIELLKRVSSSLADYYETKRFAFFTKDTRPQVFDRFVNDRPSLSSLSKLHHLSSTIYTTAVEKQNDLSYEELIKTVKFHLSEKPNTRRCMVRFANSFSDYVYSETYSPVDVTCLNLIHYLNEGPKLVFRASDVKNELLVDLLTINEFFLTPVYGSTGAIVSVYASTAQGVDSWNEFTRLLETIERKEA